MSQRSPMNQRSRTNEVSGISKRSAARAKPSREAAASVRKVKTSPQNMSPDQKKAARRAQRERDELTRRAEDLVFKQDKEYMDLRRIWWFLLGGGMVVAIICAFLTFAMGEQAKDFSTPVGKAWIVAIIIAYALIIAAMAFDMIKIRPVRQKIQQKVQGLTDKRKAALVAESETKKN